MPISIRRNRVAAALAIAAFGWTAPAFADEATKEAWRLFVSDQEKPVVTAIDLSSGEKLGTFDLKGYTSHLVASASGRTIFAVQMDHDMVNVIASGLSLSDHGEHADLTVEAPKALPTTFTGGRPVHAVMHDEEVLLFFDNDGEVQEFGEDALLEGKPEIHRIKASAPHHGVAVPMGEHVLISEPDVAAGKSGELPPRKGLKVLDKDGAQVGDIATCTGLHGEATSARLTAFGCEEGVLVARPGSNGPELQMLAYDKDLPKAKVGTLLGGKAMQFFLGNYGEDKVVIIDPDAEKPYRLVDLPVRRVDFALDDAKITLAYILTEDGKLNVLDIAKGEIVRSATITEPYSKDGHWRDPRPRLAVAGNEIAVTDPRKQVVRIIDAETLAEKRTIAVEGLPFNIVAVGGSGVVH